MRKRLRTPERRKKERWLDRLSRGPKRRLRTFNRFREPVYWRRPGKPDGSHGFRARPSLAQPIRSRSDIRAPERSTP